MSPRPFESLTPQEVLALAIHVERANTSRFRAFADSFRGYDDAVATRFEELAAEEEQHEAQLTERFHARFGAEIPQVDEVEVEGVIESPDLDDAEHQIFSTLQPARVYELALRAEEGARHFYERALSRAPDPDLEGLYRELALAEDDHVGWATRKLEEAREKEGAG